ncbi:MAG: hypothetical protein Q9207_004659 [Kuettlingeria erythrocarpa]
MTLLLGCPGLQKLPHFGITPGELEISIWDFQNVMVGVHCLIEEGLAAEIWPDVDCAIEVSNCADILWNYLPTNLPIYTMGRPVDRGSSHRQACNAAQALTFLDARLNSVFSDRLAILANLCNYDHRIDTKVMEVTESSFTICAHTLAILNGDMSLLAGYREDDESLRLFDEFKERFPEGELPKSLSLAGSARSDGRLVYANDNSDSPWNTYGFSWGPKPVACLKKIMYLEDEEYTFRLRPATLSAQGLRVSGILWNVYCAVPVPKTQILFAPKWEEELELLKYEKNFDGHDRRTPFIQQFLWTLVKELHSSRYLDLAKTLWNFVQPSGRDPVSKLTSYALPVPYPFETVFEQHPLDSEKRKK